ncbi:hypothetical protein QTP88_013699 [Uroleucon formosanum]
MDDIRVCDKRSDESAGLGQTTATLVDPASIVPDRQSGRQTDPGVGREYWRLQGVPWTQDACDCKLVFRLAGVRRASNSRIPRAPDAAGEVSWREADPTRPLLSLSGPYSAQRQRRISTCNQSLTISLSPSAVILDTALTGVLRLFKFYLGTLHRNATIMQVVRIVDEAFWIYTPAHDIIDEEAIEGQEN